MSAFCLFGFDLLLRVYRHSGVLLVLNRPTSGRRQAVGTQTASKSAAARPPLSIKLDTAVGGTWPWHVFDEREVLKHWRWFGPREESNNHTECWTVEHISCFFFCCCLVQLFEGKHNRTTSYTLSQLCRLVTVHLRRAQSAMEADKVIEPSSGSGAERHKWKGIFKLITCPGVSHRPPTLRHD